VNVAEVLKANLANELPLGPTDWYYKNIIPKDFKQNIEYRRKMLEIGYSDPSLARELKIICSRDILFEINTFGWTYNPKTHPNAPVRTIAAMKPWTFTKRTIQLNRDLSLPPHARRVFVAVSFSGLHCDQLDKLTENFGFLGVRFLFLPFNF
jgi:hypothetical protein